MGTTGARVMAINMIAFLSAAAVLIASGAAAIPPQVVVVNYDGAGGSDLPYDSALGVNCELFVSGNDTVGGIGRSVIQGYDNTLAALPGWPAIYSVGGMPAIAYGVATDLSNNVIGAGYVSGTGGDALLLKYSLAGALIGSYQYDSPDNSLDMYWDVATDAAGNVFAVGTEVRVGSSYNWLIHKYGPNVSLGPIAYATYNGTISNFDEAYAVAVHPSGDVIVAGYEQNTSYPRGSNWLVRCYDNSLSTVRWEYRWQNNTWPSMATDDRANDIAFGPAGEIYVTGSAGHPNYDQEWVVAKLTYSGSTVTAQWVTEYNPTASIDRPQSIAVDSSGNVVVSGFWSAGNRDWLIMSFDPTTGAPIPSSSYSYGTVGEDEATGIRIDSCGNWFVSGLSYAAGTGLDWRVAKYGSSSACTLCAVPPPPPCPPAAIAILSVGGCRRTMIRVADCYPASGVANVTINIYDSSGTLVRSMPQTRTGTPYAPFAFVTFWDNRDNGGALVPPGTYQVDVHAVTVSRTRATCVR